MLFNSSNNEHNQTKPQANYENPLKCSLNSLKKSNQTKPQAYVDECLHCLWNFKKIYQTKPQAHYENSLESLLNSEKKATKPNLRHVVRTTWQKVWTMPSTWRRYFRKKELQTFYGPSEERKFTKLDSCQNIL